MSRKAFNKSDVILILALLLAALLIFLIWGFLNRDTNSREAHILVDGSTVAVIDLGKDTIFTVPENAHVTFEVKDGAIAFTSSDCPDKVCVHTGFIRYGGQFAACLPNNVVLKIVANGKMGAQDVDTVVQ